MTDFRVVQTAVLLENLRRTAPGAPIINGDVAQLEDGSLVARAITTNSRGDSVCRWRSFDAKDDDPTVPHIWQGGDAAYDMAAEIERWPGRWTGLAWGDDPTEIDRFLATWPEVSAVIGLQPEVRPFRLFEPGQIKLRRPRGVGPVDWRQALLEHIAGNFGKGEVYDPSPLSPGIVWTIGLQPVAVQNNAAIASGRGAVRSRYPVSPDLTGQIPVRQYIPRPDFEIAITTLLSRAGNLTLMRVQTAGGQAAEEVA